MTLSKTWNNTAYSIPQSGERGWASLTNFLAALADGAQSTGKQFMGRRTATVSPVTVTATTDCYVGVNVSGAAATVNLPAGVNGQVFIIADESGAAGTYNITINPNGLNTINGTTSLVLSQDNQVAMLLFNTSNWVVLHTGSAAAPITAVTDSSTIDFTLTGGTLSATIVAGSLVNADINASAAIDYSKLNLAASIVDADVATAAAIARTKIANGSNNHVVINDGSGVLSSEAQLASTRGGTGVSNAGTLTYGANNITLTTSGATGVTLPTSGTLATLAGTEVLTNKTLSGNTATNLISGSGILTLNTSGTVTIPNTTDTLLGKATTDDLTNKSFNGTTVIKAANELRFNNSANTFYTAVKGGNNSSNLNITLPVTAPTASYFLQSSDTNGTLQWAASSISAATSTTAGSITRENTWTAYTPTVSAAFGTVTNLSAFYKVLGDSLFIRAYWVNGTVAGSTMSITIPINFTISSAKLPVANTSSNPGAVLGSWFDQGTTGGTGSIVSATGTSTSTVYMAGRASGNTMLQPNVGTASTTSANYSIYFEVPIV